MLSHDDLFPVMEQFVESAYVPTEPGAVIMLVKEGQTLYRRGIGLANLEHDIPLAPEMPFRLASLTKPFTATAILILKEAGQLALDNPLTKFLPDYPHGAASITLEHLLTHTSGIQNYTHLPEWWAVHRQDLSLPELIDLFKGYSPVFAPRTRWAYNNSGYVLLGAVIEKVSGQPYGQFIQQHIFAPLNMRHSYYDDTSSRVIPRQVNGYSKSTVYIHAEYLSYTQVYAAGALISTVDDLGRWYAGLRAGRLLQPATLEQAWQPYRLADGSLVPYGYGWMLSVYQGRRVVEHYGLILGFAAYLIALPDDDIFGVVLSNNDSKASQPERLAFELAALALGQPYQAPTPIVLLPEQLPAYAGQYQTQDGTTLAVSIETGYLCLHTAGGRSFELQPISPVEFFTPEIPLARVRFGLDVNQQAVELEWLPRQKTPTRAWRSIPKTNAT